MRTATGRINFVSKNFNKSETIKITHCDPIHLKTQKRYMEIKVRSDRFGAIKNAKTFLKRTPKTHGKELIIITNH